MNAAGIRDKKRSPSDANKKKQRGDSSNAFEGDEESCEGATRAGIACSPSAPLAMRDAEFRALRPVRVRALQTREEQRGED